MEKIEELNYGKKIGSEINHELIGKRRKTLIKNKDIFVWSQDKVPGVKGDLVELSLNINPSAKSW